MQKIATFLWFDKEAKDAAEFYVSLFKNSRVTNVSHYPEGSPETPGSVMTVNFELDSQEYIALNAGPMFKFTEAISLFVNCDDQAEVDRLWSALTNNGGEESQCGWLKDRWGLSWQIIPTKMMSYVGGSDPEGSKRAMQAMLQMRKIDLATIESAYKGA